MGDAGRTPEASANAPDPDAIRLQLDRILASPQFASAPSLGKMLRFVVEHALAGQADRLKEYTLGVEVFGRGDDFDPRQDTIVRVQGRRLRDRLDEYYRGPGQSDPVAIRLPKGHYIPVFDPRAPQRETAVTPEAPAQASPLPPHPARLRRWVGLAALLGLSLLAVALWSRPDTSLAVPASAATEQRPSIAVMPFADLSQAQDQAYLGEGLAEEILNQLAQVPALRLVGRSSSFSFRGSNEGVRAIGHKLGVAHLLQGSVRRDGSRLRITAQLVRADDGTHLWSKTYARDLRDLFAVQDEIARDVAMALSVKLDVVALNRAQGGTTNVAAYERFLRWRSIEMRELSDFAHDRERLQLAREMVALDPRCVLCLDALARSLNLMANEVGESQATPLRTESRQVRARIAEIAPDSWVARRDRSNTLWRQGKRADAIALAKSVMDAGPLTKERVWDYTYMIYAMGHLDDTIALVEQVRAIEPTALFLSRDLQFDYTAARRYRDAEAEYQRGLGLEGSQMQSTYVAFFRQLAGQRPGGPDELRALHRRLLQEERMRTPVLHDLGRVLDDRDAMLALVRRALVDDNYGGNGRIADVLTSLADALGDADLAAAALRKLFEAQDGFSTGTMPQGPYVHLWNSPYSALRAHPDFKKLLVETGVVDYWRQTGKWGDGCRPVGDNDLQCR